MKNKLLFSILLLLLLFSVRLSAQALKEEYFPIFGAQVFIEPGQTAEETELWFKTLHDNGMNFCRIRMFECYMHKSNGWDFSLFDRAFRFAEKYNIKVLGTFFPLTDKTDIGGWKFPKDQLQLDAFAEYIKQLTTHFKQFKSLYGWVLINEPGGGFNDTEFMRQKRQEWNKSHPTPEYLSNGYPLLVDLQTDRFKEDLTSWFLQWISSEVRKYDKTAHLHVNNHNIFLNVGEYNFIQWRKCLNSLGGSAHAGWHFVMFPRQEYDIAMSADCEMLYSGAGNLPWFMTEIQGGNNTFSANKAMCPTKEEITQWLWIILATEGKGGIFWSLNPRASGIESGEWALLDFQHQPTDRVAAISSVSKCVHQNRTLFTSAKKVDSGINILYLHESLWTEKMVTNGTPAATDGRIMCMDDMLGYFKAFSQCGVSPNFKSFEEFDFNKNDYSGQTIILADQLAFPSNYVSLLESFVKKGGKLIVDGLTGFYDENVHNAMLTGFSLRNLFGGRISEFKRLDNPYSYHFNNSDSTIFGFGWKGLIRNDEQAKVLVSSADEKLPLATVNHFGKGEVVWVPSLLGSGLSNGCYSLADWLIKECDLKSYPISFKSFHKDLIMKEMMTNNGCLTVAVNKSASTKTIELNVADSKLSPSIIFADKNGSVSSNILTIHPEETLVVLWKR